jgi:acetolactate synthase-1/3 small subunit
LSSEQSKQNFFKEAWMNNKYTISVFSENKPGVLQRITGMFTRRKLNVESLTVSETEVDGISRFTIVLMASEQLIETIVKQIRRVVEVREAYCNLDKDLLYREIAFIRVNAETAEKRAQIEEVVRRYGASIDNASHTSLVVEKTGGEEEIDYLLELFKPFGVTEFIRSGRIAIRRKSADMDMSTFSAQRLVEAMYQ